MDRIEKEEANASADNSTEGDIILADNGSNFEEEEEKIEEDVIVDRLAETRLRSSGSGQLKTPEDEDDGINDTADVYEEKKQSAHQNNEEDTDVNVQHVHQDVQQNNNEKTTSTSPQEGTIAEIPEENNNTAYEYEDPAVLENGDDRNALVPGFMFIPGPGYTGTGIHSGYVSGSDDDNIDEGAVILQGFLPEDDPSRRRRSRAESTREQRTREHVQRLIDNAITLDDSAVRPLPFEGDGDEENNDLEGAQSNNSSGRDDEVGKSDNRRWFVPLLGLLIAAGITLAIALPVSMRGEESRKMKHQMRQLH